MIVRFYGYTTQADTLRKAQMILAQAEHEHRNGDIDAWFHAGCPVGRAYRGWMVNLPGLNLEVES